jgi:hypothetical protein
MGRNWFSPPSKHFSFVFGLELWHYNFFFSWELVERKSGMIAEGLPSAATDSRVFIITIPFFERELNTTCSRISSGRSGFINVAYSPTGGLSTM